MENLSVKSHYLFSSDYSLFLLTIPFTSLPSLLLLIRFTDNIHLFHYSTSSLRLFLLLPLLFIPINFIRFLHYRIICLFSLIIRYFLSINLASLTISHLNHFLNFLLSPTSGAVWTYLCTPLLVGPIPLTYV